MNTRHQDDESAGPTSHSIVTSYQSRSRGRYRTVDRQPRVAPFPADEQRRTVGMSFLKDPDSLFPDQERRHFHPSDNAAPRAARATLGPGLVPHDEEPAAWGHHVSRTHRAHRGDAALPTGGAQGLLPEDGTHRPPASDPRWQSSYQAHTSGECDGGDDVGKPTRRKGRKVLAPASSLGSPFAHMGRSVMRQESEVTIHDGTVKNSGHVPGYSGHISAANSQIITSRNTHDKALFAENYVSQMKAFGGL